MGNLTPAQLPQWTIIKKPEFPPRHIGRRINLEGYVATHNFPSALIGIALGLALYPPPSSKRTLCSSSQLASGIRSRSRMRRGAGRNAVVLWLLLAVAVAAAEDEGNLKEECSNDFQKVVSCFDFATGKAVAPTKECCDSVKVIKDSKPECLCFFIQQTHNGNQQIKSLGIQETKLLQLPSVCSLKNSSVSYCPKLLGIPANSTDAAIFSNTTSPATPAATTTSPSGKSGTETVAKPPAGLMAMAIAVVFFTAFPAAITPSAAGA
ncbi:non-specific lipid transfer protein GPI-anchored 1 [Momordica charantia]|uniref:Non-specific lipid transfer protein GPI-anchored 1 n=1 Tax=Momordica charantia TaxID=3673 RepID=A0A6J1DC41_MOMCH|nr:non-specific lipid transfer protein GPI-anchored 1 [Momordica charantia]